MNITINSNINILQLEKILGINIKLVSKDENKQVIEIESKSRKEIIEAIKKLKDNKNHIVLTPEERKEIEKDNIDARIKIVENKKDTYILRGVSSFSQKKQKEDYNTMSEVKLVNEKEKAVVPIQQSESWEQVMKRGIVNDINKEIVPLKDSVVKDINEAKKELKDEISSAKDELKQLGLLDKRLKSLENLDSITVVVNNEKQQKKSGLIVKIENHDERIKKIEDKFDKILNILQGK